MVNSGRPTSAAGRRVAAIAELSCRMPCLLYHAPCLPCAAQRWTPSSPLLSALPHSLFLAPPRLAPLRAGAHVHHGRELSSLPLLCYTPPAKCRHQLGLPSLAAASRHRRSHPCARRTTGASPPPWPSSAATAFCRSTTPRPEPRASAPSPSPTVHVEPLSHLPPSPVLFVLGALPSPPLAAVAAPPQAASSRAG